MYAPKQPSQSRIPVTEPKTNDNQHATGSFKVPPPIIDNSQAPPEIQKYNSEKVNIITAKLAAQVAKAANTQVEAAPQREVPELGLVQRMLQNSSPSRSSIQTKLSVGEPGDKYEQEADSMARSVMSMPDSALQRQTSLGERIQQKVQAQLMKRPTNEPPNLTPLGERIQQKVQAQLMQRASDRSIEAGGNIESRLNSSQGGGNPLSEQVRAYMEPRFGTDFSQVRVHTGESAVQMNQELGAQAFTHGSNIYYGAGKAPGVDELTAHELTHVVQQTGGVQHQEYSRYPISKMTLSDSISQSSDSSIQCSFIATGDTAGFLSLVNRIIGVQYQIKSDNTGKLSVVNTNKQGPLTNEASVLISLLQKVIGDSNATTIEFMRGKSAPSPVVVGSYSVSQIDLDDVTAFGIGPQQGVSAAGKLAHEIEEQYQKQVNNQAYGNDASGAHGSGIKLENAATGAIRGAQGNPQNVVSNPDGTLNFTITIPYTYPDGKVVDVKYKVIKSNIVNVIRTQRP